MYTEMDDMEEVGSDTSVIRVSKLDIFKQTKQLALHLRLISILLYSFNVQTARFA